MVAPTNKTKSSFEQKAKENRDSFLKPYFEEYLQLKQDAKPREGFRKGQEAEKELRRRKKVEKKIAALIAELIKIEPSHLSEPWILWEIIENVTNVIAVEFLCAAQAIDLRDDGPRRLGEGTRIAHGIIRKMVQFYGRDKEMARLDALFKSAAAGEGQVVLVEGEAGIGRTRLVDELVGRLRADGEDLNFLFGAYPPGGAATAAGAFSTAYREHFGSENLEEGVSVGLEFLGADAADIEQSGHAGWAGSRHGDQCCIGEHDVCRYTFGVGKISAQRFELLKEGRVASS